MRLDRLLANLGYGSRKEVQALLARGRVTTADGRRLGPKDKDPGDGVRVDGDPLDPRSPLVVRLHKPAGFVCSRDEPGQPLVYDLLPPRFRRRKPVLAPVGRLDKDTTGLLLLTDDGALLHRLTHPRRHVPKVYRATLARDLAPDAVAVFASGGLVLRGEDTPLKPATLEQLGRREARVTVSEGRYHQVRRMFAAVGNHVEALHRESMGGLGLGGLAEGAWDVLDDAEDTLSPP